jgi:hypothetical protein
MTPEMELASCQQELSSLEVESLEVLVYPSESQQDRSLHTLTTTPSEVEIAALLTGTSPVNSSGCCCCCCPACCCC